MTKTPEELALEYAHTAQIFWDGTPIEHHIVVCKEMAFLAGYKAGHAAGFESAMKIHDAVAERILKTENICADVVQHEPLLHPPKE